MKKYLILIPVTISMSCLADTVIIQNYSAQTDLYSNCQYQSPGMSAWSGYVQLEPATTDSSGRVVPSEQTVTIDCLTQFVLSKGGYKQCAADSLAPGHTYKCYWKPDSTVFTKSYTAPQSYSCSVTRTFKIRDNKKGNIFVKVDEQKNQAKKK